MIPNIALNKYRPTRVSDGAGGSTEAYGDPTIIYGSLRVNGTEVLLIIPTDEDVLINDVFCVKEN